MTPRLCDDPACRETDGRHCLAYRFRSRDKDLAHLNDQLVCKLRSWHGYAQIKLTDENETLIVVPNVCAIRAEKALGSPRTIQGVESPHPWPQNRVAVAKLAKAGMSTRTVEPVLNTKGEK